MTEFERRKIEAYDEIKLILQKSERVTVGTFKNCFAVPHHLCAKIEKVIRKTEQ